MAVISVGLLLFCVFYLIQFVNGCTNVEALKINIEKGDLEAVKKCMKSIENVDEINYDGATPFLESLWANNTEIARYFMKNGANVSVVDPGGSHPIHIVAKNGNMELFLELLPKIKDPLAADFDGFTAIHLAAGSGHKDILSLIFKDLCGGFNTSDPLFELDVSINQSYDTKQKFNQVNASFCANVESLDGITPLMFSTLNGDLEIIKFLTKVGANIHYRNSRGSDAFSWAIQAGHLDVVKHFVSLNVSVHPSGDSLAPILWAVYKRSTQIIDFLLSQGADISQKHVDGRSAFHFACESLDSTLMTHILELNSSHFGSTTPSSKDNKGNTALHACAQAGMVFLEVLLEHGVDANALNDDGKTAAQVATDNGFEFIAQMLTNKHAPIPTDMNSEVVDITEEVKNENQTEAVSTEKLEDEVKPNLERIFPESVVVTDEDMKDEGWNSPEFLKLREQYDARVQLLHEQEAAEISANKEKEDNSKEDKEI